jgi:hypothetical protein
MTRIQVLQDARAEWVEKLNAAKETIGEIFTREQKAISDTIYPFFSQFTPEVQVEVTRGSVYFKMQHPDREYAKEIFNLYLREDWSESGKSFKGIDLSYYTTSTSGMDTWELKRLQLLGAVAEIVLEHQDRIVDRVNHTVAPFKQEYETAYQLQNMVNTAINDIDKRIRHLTREKVLFDLQRGVVEFTQRVCIDFKYNYSANVQALKLTNISKSGKTADAVFAFYEGTDLSYTENNCNVEKIVDQVAHYSQYVKDTKKELLPS